MGQMKTIKRQCCITLDEKLVNHQFPLDYEPIFREYALVFIGDSTKAYPINNCPWCGKKLPKNLGEAYFDTLESEYGIEDPDDPRLPEEFNSDEWWKKRGL